MKKSILFAVCMSVMTLLAFAQEEGEDIVKIIDDLTLEWDEGAEQLRTYESLKEYCRIKPYRDRTIKLLNQIHHYDTVLYMIVTEKFDANKDPEAEATLKDIDKLEIEYTTASFKKFLHKECNTVNEIENNVPASSAQYGREVKALEKELKKFVDAITAQIDLIDEHVHHLEGL